MTAPPSTAGATTRAVEDGDRASAGDAARTETRTRVVVLGGLALAALALRLVMIFAVHPLCDFDPDAWGRDVERVRASIQFPDRATTGCFPLEGDALYIYLQGRMVADGQGFDDPIRFITDGSSSPSAWRPPGGTVLVATMATLGLRSPDAVRVLDALIGTATVVVLGVAAWRIGGRRAGIATATIAAVYPMFVTNDWKMLTETPYALGMALVLLLAYRVWERPRPGVAVALGVVIGLLSYVRYEAPLLLLFVGLPLGVGMRLLTPVDRLRLMVTIGLPALAIWAPLLIVNQTRFAEPGLVGTGGGWGLMNGTCDNTWYGDRLGTLDFHCFDLAATLEAGATSFATTDRPDESVVDGVYRRRAVDYVRDNLPRAPFVATVRVLRLWGLWDPVQTIDIDSRLEGRGTVDSWATMVGLYAVSGLAVAGAVSLRRRRVPISPIVGPVLMVSVTAAASFALSRYRLPAEVAMVLAAGVGVDVVWRWVRRRTGGPAAGEAGLTPSGVAPTVVRRAERLRALPAVRVPKGVLAGAGVIAVLLAGVVVWSSRQTPPSDGALPAEVCTQLVAFRDLQTDGVPDANQVPDIARQLAAISTSASGVDPQLSAAASDVNRLLFEVMSTTDPLATLRAVGEAGVRPAVDGLDLLTARTRAAC